MNFENYFRAFQFFTKIFSGISYSSHELNVCIQYETYKAITENCNRLADIIRHYFSNGLAYSEVTELIGLPHSYSMTLSTLKRWLRSSTFFSY